MTDNATIPANTNLYNADLDATTFPRIAVREVRLPDGQSVRALEMDAAHNAMLTGISDRDMILKVVAGFVRVHLAGVNNGVLGRGDILAVPRQTAFNYQAISALNIAGGNFGEDTPAGLRADTAYIEETYSMPPRA